VRNALRQVLALNEFEQPSMSLIFHALEVRFEQRPFLLFVDLSLAA
jgi:hypothetical protein